MWWSKTARDPRAVHAGQSLEAWPSLTISPARRRPACARHVLSTKHGVSDPEGTGCVIWRIWPPSGELCPLPHLLKLSSQRTKNKNLLREKKNQHLERGQLHWLTQHFPQGRLTGFSATHVTAAWAGRKSAGAETNTRGHWPWSLGLRAVPGEKAALGELWLGRSWRTAARPSLVPRGAWKGPDQCCPVP